MFTTLAAQSKIYPVRHSEKLEGWETGLSNLQPLSEEGIKTSKRLADYFKDIPVDAIYSSNTTRTMQTAFYLCKQKNITINVAKASSDTSAINSFLNDLSKEFANDKSILIVTHSNIIPYFLIKSGLTEDKYSEMGFTKYYDWWVTDFYGEIFVIENKGDTKKIYRQKF